MKKWLQFLFYKFIFRVCTLVFSLSYFLFMRLFFFAYTRFVHLYELFSRCLRYHVSVLDLRSHESTIGLKILRFHASYLDLRFHASVIFLKICVFAFHDWRFHAFDFVALVGHTWLFNGIPHAICRIRRLSIYRLMGWLNVFMGWLNVFSSS